MSYRVIKEFADSKDKYHVYKVGDLFPHNDKQIDEGRITELSTDANALKTPLIKEEAVEEKPKKTAKAKTKE